MTLSTVLSHTHSSYCVVAHSHFLTFNRNTNTQVYLLDSLCTEAPFVNESLFLRSQAHQTKIKPHREYQNDVIVDEI